MTEDFFDEATAASVAKSKIVFDYFRAWSRIILPHSNGKIAYIDLYSGPGIYGDGTKSTPLLVIEEAVRNSQLQSSLVTIFNDVDSGRCQALEQELAGIPDISLLAYAPQVCCGSVDVDLATQFGTMRLVPTLLFLDPWGYKGVSLQLVNAVLKDWACECLFLFNYNRVNMALQNPKMQTHMNALFGERRVDALRKSLTTLPSGARETAVVESLAEALTEEHGGTVIAFRFPSQVKARTSHYLVFVTKHPLGYDIMKQIMAKAGGSSPDGVPTYEYTPPVDYQQFGLFDGQRIEDLMDDLVRQFAGRRLTVKEIYKEHGFGKPYVPRNYKAALIRLEEQQMVTASRPAGQRRNGTLADSIEMRFKKRGGG